ncbi:MAG: hypothetical protein U5L09_07140 [Bacteroidales bacterium]|nr:hypothetical protein [Bacteroidales bacterium]
METNSPVCEGDTITLTANDIEDATCQVGQGPEWFLGDGSPGVKFRTADESDEGDYSVIVSIEGNDNQPISAYVTVKSTPES